MVNNAGVACIGLIEWMPFEEFKRTADVNLWGLIDVTKTFLPLVRKAEGRVVNFSSMLGQCVNKPKHKKVCSIPMGFEESFQQMKGGRSGVVTCDQALLSFMHLPFPHATFNFIF